MSRWLIISDTQIPFQHPQALEFVLWVKKEFSIPSENILHAGDEVDIYFGSQYTKDPSVNFSAVAEIEASRQILRQWYRHIPKLRIAISNHGTRWVKKAVDAELPSQVIKSLAEIYESPKGWIWQPEWRIKAKHPFRLIHGVGYSGFAGARNAAIDAHMSTAIGHLHSHGGVSFVNTNGAHTRWGMNVGCLVDEESFAFEYGKHSRAKPTLGCGVVLNDGALPVFVPFDAWTE